MSVNILLVERKHSNLPSFEAGLIRKNYAITIAKNGAEAVQLLSEEKYDLVIVNAASMRTTGTRICQNIQKESPDNHIPIILIVEKPFDDGESIEADTVLVLPFTLQKLVNRIKPYQPTTLKNAITLGNLTLDLDTRCVHKDDSQSVLTPRLFILLRLFMANPGEVISREDIFYKVWDTDFFADMRTLDVHISWLRQIIEDDPRKPQLIRTVRGKGYKFVHKGD
jgi:DNA-binding response OmpR family regulator